MIADKLNAAVEKVVYDTINACMHIAQALRVALVVKCKYEFPVISRNPLGSTYFLYILFQNPFNIMDVSIHIITLGINSLEQYPRELEVESVSPVGA